MSGEKTKRVEIRSSLAGHGMTLNCSLSPLKCHWSRSTFNNISFFFFLVSEENGYFEVCGCEENNKEMIVVVQVGGNEGPDLGCSHAKCRSEGR